MNLTFKIIKEQWEIDKWNKLFRLHYDGNTIPYSGAVRKALSSSSSKYIRVECEGQVIGYARLLKRAERFEAENAKCTWSIEEILVASEFRHKGVARSLIEHLRDTYEISHIHMTKKRAQNLVTFHSELGFSLIRPHPTDSDMAYVTNAAWFRSKVTTLWAPANDNASGAPITPIISTLKGDCAA